MRGCFGSWKIQSGPSVFHIGPLHGLIWPRCKGQISPKFWYQNSPISIGLNWPQKQYRSGLTRFGPIFGAELALFILQCINGHEELDFFITSEIHFYGLTLVDLVAFKLVWRINNMRKATVSPILKGTCKIYIKHLKM